jgi:HlyD family type I secretion membrane fusion protein
MATNMNIVPRNSDFPKDTAHAAVTSAADADSGSPMPIDAAAERGGVLDWRRPAKFGYAVVFLAFGVLGGWSALAKLDSAVLAQGVIALESNRKTVQHFEGGIIREINVHEGDRVQQGQVLFRLDTTQSQANFDSQRNQLDYNLAIEARLIAEREGAESITFPDDLLAGKDDPYVASAMSDQVKQFAERRGSLSGQTDVLEAKVAQYRNEIDGLTAERKANQEQLALIDQELSDLQGLLAKSLVPKSRVLNLERERSRIDGTIGHDSAEIAKTENSVQEAQLQMRELRQKFQEQVAGAILEVRQKIAELRQKVTMARDVLRRIEVNAPRAGVVQNLKVFTLGGVVKSGEPLLDIAPEHDNLIVQAHISPLEIDKIAPGMRAEIRFPSFHGDILPIMSGSIESISRDHMMDDSKQPYFLAQINVDEQSVPDYVRERLTAGMPADIVVPTGERTVLQYLTRPLQSRLRNAMREH